MDFILSTWFEQVLRNATPRGQRAKRQYRMGDQKKYVKTRMAATHTGDQIRYENKGSKRFAHIVSDNIRESCIAQPVHDIYIDQLGVMYGMDKVGILKEYFNIPIPIDSKIATELDITDYDTLNEHHIQYLRDTYIPRTLHPYLKDDANIYELVEKIQDGELRQLLYDNVVLSGAARKAVDAYLRSRLTAYNGVLQPEVVDAIRSMNPKINIEQENGVTKCIAALYYNLNKAMTESSKSGKMVNLPKGVLMDPIPLEWAALVRSERASIALRHAQRMYLSGLKTMTSGMRMIPTLPRTEDGKKIKKNAVSLKARGMIQRGYKMIINIEPQDRNTLKRDRTCAASALIRAYRDFKSCVENPSQAVIQKVHMKTLNGKDDYDMKDMDEQLQIRQDYRQRQLFYEGLGFTQTDTDYLPGLREMNWDAWGPDKDDNEDIPNPARVREETYLFRYLGDVSDLFDTTALNGTEEDNEVWSIHTITADYDTDFYDTMYIKEKDQDITRRLFLTYPDKLEQREWCNTCPFKDFAEWNEDSDIDGKNKPFTVPFTRQAIKTMNNMQPSFDEKSGQLLSDLLPGSVIPSVCIDEVNDIRKALQDLVPRSSIQTVANAQQLYTAHKSDIITLFTSDPEVVSE